MDAALSGYIGRLWPCLTQTGRQFGFRIHDGSDSAQNFGQQFERYEYFEECLRCLDRGEPEPTFEDWKAAMERRPFLRRFAHDRMVRSRHMFRRSGAALVDGRKPDFVKYAGPFVPLLAASVLLQGHRAARPARLLMADPEVDEI